MSCPCLRMADTARKRKDEPGERRCRPAPDGVYRCSGTHAMYNVSLVFMSGNILNAICLTICHVINQGDVDNSTEPRSTLLSSSLMRKAFCYQTLLTNTKSAVASRLDRQMVPEASPWNSEGLRVLCCGDLGVVVGTGEGKHSVHAFKPWLCRSLAVWTGVGYVTSWTLGFLTCKVGVAASTSETRHGVEVRKFSPSLTVLGSEQERYFTLWPKVPPCAFIHTRYWNDVFI